MRVETTRPVPPCRWGGTGKDDFTTYLGLKAFADTARWTRAGPEEWIAFAGLNALGAGVILHVAIGRRWPFAR